MENTVCRTQRDVFELKKWLRLILVFSIAHLSVIYVIPNSSQFSWRQWVLFAINIASLYCFFHLMKEHKLYSFAVTCLIIQLVTSIVSHLVTTVFLGDLIQLFPEKELSSVLSIVTTPLSVIGMIASFPGYLFELFAHSALIAPYDEKLAKQWKNLFFWNLGAGLLASAFGFLFIYLHNTSVWDYTVYQRVYPLVNLPTTAVKILYMLYLWRTIQKIVVKEDIIDGN